MDVFVVLLVIYIILISHTNTTTDSTNNDVSTTTLQPNIDYVPSSNIIDSISWKELIIISCCIVLTCLICTGLVIVLCIHYKYKMKQFDFKSETHTQNEDQIIIDMTQNSTNEDTNSSHDSNDIYHLPQINPLTQTNKSDAVVRNTNQETSVNSEYPSVTQYSINKDDHLSNMYSSITRIFHSQGNSNVEYSQNPNSRQISHNPLVSDVSKISSSSTTTSTTYLSNASAQFMSHIYQHDINRESRHYNPQHYHGITRSITALHKGYNKILYKDKLIHFKDVTYKKDDLIGAGNFGNVYVGKYKGQKVAIKIYKNNHSNKDALTKDFYSESVITANLRHDNLVNIVGYCKKPQKCILMTYVNGCNLREYCYRDKMNNSWKNVNDYGIIYVKVLCGLMCLHTNNIIHRDIAARNVLINVTSNYINKDTEVRLTDYGCARHLSRDKVDNERRENDTYSDFGPIKWMSPEAIQYKKYSISSDIYMFGMLMYEVFYRIEPYFTMANLQVAMGLVLKDLNLDFPPPKLKKKGNYLEIPKELKELILATTQNDPKNRITTLSILGCLRKLCTINIDSIINYESDINVSLNNSLGHSMKSYNSYKSYNSSKRISSNMGTIHEEKMDDETNL